MSAPWRVLLADDEPLARERLRMLLDDRPEWEVVAECEHGAEAVEAILATRPDLVFLDVRMPELDGLEVAEALAAEAERGTPPPVVVFVTAFEEHALRAFEVNARDYLTKPVDRERLDRALARAAEALARPAAGAPVLDPSLAAFLETLRSERGFPVRFPVRDAKGGLYFVRADEIDWVDAQGNYVRLHAGGRGHMVRDTMQRFAAKLNPETFVRVHRSAIVNVDRLVRVEPYARGEYTLTLRDGTRLTSSRAYSEGLRRLIR
ncbi:MAG TPA: LytTR family DNA-binding domain-containing protein [Longimicrobiaceae bacterium]